MLYIIVYGLLITDLLKIKFIRKLHYFNIRIIYCLKKKCMQV
jgi:hypothetical protein